MIRSKNKKLHTQAFYSYFQALARLDGLHSLPHCFFFLYFQCWPVSFLKFICHRQVRSDWQVEALCCQVVHAFIHTSVHQFVCYQTCEYNTLKKNEPILMPVDTSDPRDKDIERSISGSRWQRSRSHEAEIGHKNPFRSDISRTIQQILTKPGSHIFW